MVAICFYFQVHQPYRLRNYSVFDIGRKTDYFDDNKNREVLRKVGRKCYLPTNNVLLDLIKHHPEFKATFCISGVCLEQMRDYMPEVLESFKTLAATGRVEFLAETYYHSLSFLYDKEEFESQVTKHTELIQELFGQTPKVFRNTELIYNNELANHVEGMGFNAILSEGWDPVLGWRSPNFVYKSKTTNNLKLLMKNYKLSDDVAFRFSNKSWNEWPLTVEKYVDWLNSNNGNGEVINLFMDYETFGEHQWEDTGIFDFLRALPHEFLKHPDNSFVTVSEAVTNFPVRDEVDMHHYVSWADLERDLSAWLGNSMQQGAIRELYKLGEAVKETGDEELTERWRRLTTSDHFYYMCTKWFADGDVHKYFNPYDSPYEAYIAFMNVLNDIAIRAKVKLSRDLTFRPVTAQPSTHVLPYMDKETSREQTL
ncbi:polysaccharide deacetylase family protein [Candidatus Woesearchaeota archaeon]|nr:polysaccharide deacetylase family protein [Candidatus Woesearchaeota archaeon]